MMAQFEKLFQTYDRLFLFDTETTGLFFSRDQIIEFAAVVVEMVDGVPTIVRDYDELVTLAPGTVVPENIRQLTGISTEDIRQKGVAKAKVCADVAEMVSGKTLLLAYNAHFDLSFLYYMLLRDGDPMILKGKDKLDLLTVYRDRHAYPHKLCTAIEQYGLAGKVVNSHRAVDDVIATVEVMKCMEQECDDLESYINIFGYIAKFGVDGKPIGSVVYKPQDFEPGMKVYLQK